MRAKLVVVALIALLPIATLLSYLWLGARQRDRDDTLASLTQTAESVAVLTDDVFDEGIAIARAIASDPSVQSRDPSLFVPRLRSLQSLYPQYAQIVVLDTDGTMLGWSAPDPLPTLPPNLAQRWFMGQVARTRQPTAIRVVDDPDATPVGPGVAAPILGADGSLLGVVGLGFRPEALTSRLASVKLFPGQVLALIDPNSRLAALVNQNGATAMTNLSREQRDRTGSSEVQAALRGEVVTSAGFRASLTGQDRLAAFVATPRHGWVVGATWTAAEALGPTRQAEQRELLIFATIVLIIVAGALLASRTLIAPLRRLAEHARRLGDGQFQPVADAHRDDELGDLAATFNTMGERLQETVEHLRRRDLLLRTLIGQFPGMVNVIDREYRYVVASDRRLVDVGLSGAQLVSRRATELLPPARAEAFAADAQRAFAGETVSREASADGKLYLVTATPLRDEGGSIDYILTIGIDITEERAQLERAAQNEQLRALGQMAGGIAHDLNQALTLVAGYAELGRDVLDRDRPDLDALREMIQIMGQAAYDGGETVKRLLMFSRGEVDEHRQVVEIAVLLHEIAQLTAPRWRDMMGAEGRPVARVDTTSSPTVVGSRSSLREALTNLIFNALDAMPAGGTIVLSARQDGNTVAIDIADSGLGMTPEVKARVFEPFFTTKGERGTGLGLPMVFGIVQRHGGKIDVLSEPGRGTTVRLILPVGSLADGDAVQQTVDGAARALRILVVDDETKLAELLSQMLKRDGHHTTTAASGQEAVEQLQQEAFDLVITDLSMGGEMNGWDLANAIRQRFPGRRVILATGWGAGIDEEQARGRGVHAVIPKPYRVADIRAAIARAVSL